MKTQANNNNKNLLRHAILLQLEAAYPASLQQDTLHQGLILAGHSISKNDLTKHILYLQGKNFVSARPHALSRDIMRYQLSSKGRDYLEAQGLA